jgi:hypothetical protein
VKEQHGALHVTLTSEKNHLAYIKRTFDLKDPQTGVVCQCDDRFAIH